MGQLWAGADQQEIDRSSTVQRDEPLWSTPRFVRPAGTAMLLHLLF